MRWNPARLSQSLRRPLLQGTPPVSRVFFKSMSTRSYQDAVEHLNSLQSNAATLEAVRASGGRLSEFAIPEMLEYLDRIGYTPSQLNALNVIHITGTKGKGSTSAFTESIIRHSKPEWKTGLYTSPHLVAVRERIRIDGVPISESDFAKYFFEIWDRLVANQNAGKVPTTPPMPGYFRFITLMAFHVFLELKVDATILEVGVGGAYDSTNVVPAPIVTGITVLGIDHVFVLGKTISEIAWQKGGILKKGVPALTVAQPVDAMKVLESRAEELKASKLSVVSDNSELSTLKLGLAGSHQVQNAILAVELARSFLEKQTGVAQDTILPISFQTGLVNTRWPGRCQTVVDPKRLRSTWYLDGAHTVESLECCMQWFVSPGVGIPLQKAADLSTSTRVLIFNCTSGRSGESFLGRMIETTRLRLALHKGEKDAVLFNHVIFCTNVTYADGHFKGDLTTKAIADSDLAGLKTQQALASAWSSLAPSYPKSHIHVLPSIEHAVKEVENIQSTTNNHVQTLVTGSLHLVGGIIEVAGLSEVAL